MPGNGGFLLDRLRKALGLSQAEMARRMGLSLRPYQKLEKAPKKVQRRHVRLAESVALDVAIEKEEPELAPLSVRKKAMQLARVMMTQNFRTKARQLVAIILGPE